MFEKEVIDFAYKGKAAKYLLYHHFSAPAEPVVESEITNKRSEKIISRALR